MLLTVLLVMTGLSRPAESIPAEGLPRIVPAAAGTHFVREGTAEPFVVWGFNYDRDDSGRLLEDYWDREWETVAADFQEMKDLGANLVRIHLQLARFMTGPEQTSAENLARLGKLLDLAESLGLYLDITGLGCYHAQDVPPWYDEMDEPDRWAVQARFWRAVAGVCKDRSVVFCYDLMNEPVLGGGEHPEKWLVGEPLGGKYYVQRITTDTRGRDDKVIARAWVNTLCDAIREVDSKTLVTVGVIPWGQAFPGAKDVFYSDEVGRRLSFVSIHLYPRAGKRAEDLAVVRSFVNGKPIVVEEIFPLSAGIAEVEGFLTESRAITAGWVSFYWGKTTAEYARETAPTAALMGPWLDWFRAHAPDRGAAKP